MEIRKVNNPDLIQKLMREPRVYERLSEDGAPKAEDWVPNLALSIWVIVYEPQDDGSIEQLGLFAFVPETSVVWRFHPVINPDYWGNKQNLEAGKLAVDWFWKHTNAQKLVGKVPAIYPDLLKWGQRLGFSREGIQRASFAKNGKLHDQWHMGISRP